MKYDLLVTVKRTLMYTVNSKKSFIGNPTALISDFKTKPASSK